MMMESEVVDVMIDIETLGTTPGSVTASIGAVEFTRHAGLMNSSLYVKVDIIDAQKQGSTIDAHTVLWWMQQSENARNELTSGHRVKLQVALDALDFYINSLRGEGRICIWAHSPSFDLIHLEAAYKLFNRSAPWRYNESRDTRTIFDLAGIDLKDYRIGTSHNALDDAKSQVTAVIAALHKLQLGPMI